MISFIVSVYDRTQMLKACLASLAVQDTPHRVVVCDNSPDSVTKSTVDDSDEAWCMETGKLGAKSCYESAGMAAEPITSGWLCFPSDDSLYVQGFSRIMLETAEREKAYLVYCDCIYAQHPNAGKWPAYTILNVQPRMGHIDKTCFILRRELFKGFPSHPKGWCDGALIEQLSRDGVKMAKAPGVLVIHQ